MTLASLGLGWAGEDTLYQMLLKILYPVITPSTSYWLHGMSFAVAFLTISFVHVVIGEVVPKNLAIEKADRLALLMAPALLVFLRISAPFVFVRGTRRFRAQRRDRIARAATAAEATRLRS